MATCLFAFWMFGLSILQPVDNQRDVQTQSTPTLLAQNAEGTLEPPTGEPKVGQIKLVGKYKSQQLKDGDKTVNYFKLGKGEQIVLKVIGPAPLILRMHGIHKKPINLVLTLDNKEKQTQTLPFLAKDAWKTLYTQVPAGQHVLALKVPANLFVRPIKVNREPDANEKVISWNLPSLPAAPPETPVTVASKKPTTPAAPASDLPASAGEIAMIGKYKTAALKEGGAAVNYFKLGKGEQLTMKVTGPAAVLLKMHGIHKKAIKLKLALDSSETQEQAMPFPRKDAWKAIYTEIPQGEHTLAMTIPAKLFVRPLSVKRDPQANEMVVAWAAPSTPAPSAVAAAPAIPALPAPSPTAPQVVAMMTPSGSEPVKNPEAPAEVKPRMIQGEEVSLSGAMPTSKLKLVHRSLVKDYFQLVSIAYLLDGKPIVQKAGGVDADLSSEMTVFDAAVEPGAHTLAVKMVYQGKAKGIFTYMEGYRYVTSSEFPFVIPNEKTLQVQVMAGEKTGFTLLMEQRPEIRYTAEVASNL